RIPVNGSDSLASFGKADLSGRIHALRCRPALEPTESLAMPQRFSLLAVCALTVCALMPLIPITASSATKAGSKSMLSTIAERSGYQRTGRYDEVEHLCAA